MYVDQAKSAETRKIRGERMAESLMLAMDGERRDATDSARSISEAAVGAGRLGGADSQATSQSPARIFYVQTVQGRKRAALAVEEALQVARRKAGQPRDSSADFE